MYLSKEETYHIYLAILLIQKNIMQLIKEIPWGDIRMHLEYSYSLAALKINNLCVHIISLLLVCG